MHGKAAHCYSLRRGFSHNVYVGSSLVDMYAKCGKIVDSRNCFDRLPTKNLVCWNAIMHGYAMHGLAREAIDIFELMQRSEQKPDFISLNCVLSACCQDAGRLEEAYAMIKEMRSEPDACVWGALLSSCRVHGSGMWKEVNRVRGVMENLGLRKNPGCSWIEVKNKVHTLLAGDRSHPNMAQIIEKLERLGMEMKKSGYCPDTNFVLQDVEEQDKENILCGHSEKLAVCLGLLSTPPGTCLRVIKNLRICGDCHTAIKFIARFEGREIYSLIRSFRAASNLTISIIKELAVSIEGKSMEEKKSLFAKCAATTLSSKLIGGEKEFFASMVVDSVISIGNDDRLNMIGIKKTFSYAGFKQQPKKFLNPKMLLLNIELELKSEKENAEIRLSDPLQYQSIVDAEWNIIYDKLDKCYFADRDVFCAGRVTEEDLQRVAAASGRTVQTSVNNVIDEVLGTCEVFEECQVGNEHFNIFSGCPSGRTATIVLRGGADQFIEEAERSLHDAIMIVRRALKNSTVVAGGGAIDVILRQLCDNAGFDATDVLNKVRQKHALPSGEGALYGSIHLPTLYGNLLLLRYSMFFPINAINVATEAACLILSVDETVKNPKVSRRVHKEMLLLERRVEGVVGQISLAVEGECAGVELWGLKMPRTS
ncbi:hypothetical protein IFM89_001914 [Coptis chinensis]|uniref:DYW domain-containing protein n=1 Tax=Coptis chinensis TaxID=261450 RepID=A0A835IL21_9MAGN|nr:hypothetical protein IFM89_001914 [Coptis chinensis]